MSFDVEALLAKPVSGAMSTERIVVPEGIYAAISGTKINIRTPQDFVVLEIPWEIDDPEVAKETGRAKSVCYSSMFLDIDDNTGELDLSRGMNSELGSLREVLGQNTDQPWTLPELSGQVASVTIKHEMVKGKPIAKVVKIDKLV